MKDSLTIAPGQQRSVKRDEGEMGVFSLFEKERRKREKERKQMEIEIERERGNVGRREIVGEKAEHGRLSMQPERPILSTSVNVPAFSGAVPTSSSPINPHYL